MRRYLVVVAMASLAACGHAAVGTGPSSHATVSPTTTAPSPSAATSVSSSSAIFDLLPPAAGAPATDVRISCARSIGASDPVAIVQLHTGTTVLRDYADVAHPYTACQFATGFITQLIDAHHVVVPAQGIGSYAVVDLPEVRVHMFQLPAGDTSFLAVAPGLDAIAWLRANLSNNTDEVHITAHGGDRLVGSLPNPHGGRCGSPDDSKMAGFTESGKDLFVLDQPIPTLNSLLVVEGGQTVLRIAPDSGSWPAGAQPGMALWSPTSATLYYRKGGDVWTWTHADGSQTFLPGISWYYPTISSDGLHLAFAEVGQDGLHTVSLLDLPPSSRPILVGNGHRTLPLFLNARQLWYKSESVGPCGPGGNQPLVYDLADHSESPSIIDQPIAVWPATSSNF